ncbi:hypothetical protein A3Q56_03482 [Intoshia linei]|uniref:Uncharacterized protein n=1 Tax=Intoshia linei TaxID=1819745 RepID=A0A177B4X7_9BILA|nr:hypothetical protein A3Q56_03482 [Intoshia linei]
MVELVKAVNNHKRFTFTPLISASGVMEKILILFTNLNIKRIPKNLNQKGIVEVNKTVDSFSGHLGIEDKYEEETLIIRYIPPGMTGILQLPDFFCNKGFQQYYRNEYDNWLAHNIDNNDIFTVNRNLKKVPYSKIVDWCLNYKDQVESGLIQKRFKEFGILFGTFYVDQCHSQLKNLILEKIKKKISLNRIFYSDIHFINISEWDLEVEY